MLDDGDILSVTVEQTSLGEDILNIFYYVYEVSLIGATILDVLLEFQQSVWTFVRGGMNPDMETNAYVGRNLSNGVDIETLVFPQIGLDITGGDISPTSLAAGYSLLVGSLETRPGSKRFAGISEQRVNDNIYDAGGVIAANIESSLAQILDVVGAVSGEGSAIPTIVGRDILGALELTRTQPVITAEVAGTVRTQVSRRV
ncbi:MAG: hypothetical protein KAJ19_23635 [Gammaproteobacteria bacterium]|nr:hypothetical protein [Gammaproteobacteria bacterium]